MSCSTDDKPLYPIGVVSKLLDVHPETLRGWEKFGIVGGGDGRDHHDRNVSVLGVTTQLP